VDESLSDPAAPYRPEDLANAILILASAEAAYITGVELLAGGLGAQVGRAVAS
jgi:NAD(P)-dependent dehydrogenase (short-subunit alcohol dehydrogenase family)